MGEKRLGREGKKVNVSFSSSMLGLKPRARKRMVLERDNAMEMTIPHQGRSLALKPFSISSNWPVLGHWSSAH